MQLATTIDNEWITSFIKGKILNGVINISNIKSSLIISYFR